MKKIIHFIKKEFIQFKRDPKMRIIIFIAPVIQLIFFGYAARFDVDIVKTAFFDQDKSVASREFIKSFESSGYFQVEKFAKNYDDVEELIDEGKIILAIIIPKDFEKKINRNETIQIQAIFDGSDGNTASVSAGYVAGITLDFSKQIIIDYSNKVGMKSTLAGSVSPEIRIWYNPEMKTRTFMVPAIVGLLLTIITLLLTSLAIVKEKEIGTLEQLHVTPIKPYQMLIGKLVPFTIIGFLVILLVVNAMYFIFNIPVRGSMLFLYFASFVYVLSSLGLGLLVSTISNTQQQAMMMVIFLFLLPMIYLSGFAFPIENMPVAVQYITYLVPLRYFITIIRGVILKGAGLAELWQETLLLFSLGVIILWFASSRFKKREA